MQHNRLGDTGPMVSTLCLGTMTFGEQNTQAQAHAQLDRAVAAGVNFIDTAEIYPVPPRAETQGLTETYIGTWLQSRGGRDRLILASKVAGPGAWVGYLRDGNPRLDRRNIVAALDASLKRLQTDYLDLYQLHWPDRETNYFGKLGYEPVADEHSVPLLETLEVLADLVRAGKVRQVGVSNETPWGLMTALRLAEVHGLPRPVSIQNPYNLLNRSFEIGLAEVALREHCGLSGLLPAGLRGPGGQVPQWGPPGRGATHPIPALQPLLQSGVGPRQCRLCRPGPPPRAGSGPDGPGLHCQSPLRDGYHHRGHQPGPTRSRPGQPGPEPDRRGDRRHRGHPSRAAEPGALTGLSPPYRAGTFAGS